MGYFVEVEPNIRIYVEDLNPEGGTPIVFIHGWPANHKMFEYQFTQLPRKGYRCIGIDLRGFGYSSKPWSGYDYNRSADDVRCVVETLDLQDFILCGHSTGGAIAVRYMARHKGYRAAKLALFAAAAPSLIQRPGFPHGLTREAVDTIIQQAYDDRPSMLQGFGNMFFFQHVTVPFSAWFFQLGLEAAAWSTIAVANSWLREELFSDLGEICAPTLILHGIHDEICLFPLAIAQHKEIKNSKLVPFKFSGHGLFYDERDKFNQELIQFIEE